MIQEVRDEVQAMCAVGAHDVAVAHEDQGAGEQKLTADPTLREVLDLEHVFRVGHEGLRR
jgi:hypothetical protein